MNDTESMRARIIREIERRQISQRDIAKSSGVSEATVSLLLSGKRRVGIGTHIRVLAALGVPIKMGGRG